MYLTVSLVLAFNFCNAQKLQIKLDYSNAEQTLKILNAREFNPEEFQILQSMESTKALLRKINSDSLELLNTVKSLYSENPIKNNYQYTYIEKESLSTLIGKIKDSEEQIKDKISAKLLGYVPDHKEMSITVHFILGGFSSGFTLGDESNFYIGLHLYKNDLTSIINTATHELFHNLQKANYNSRPVSEKLQQNDLGLAYVHAILTYLFMEGTAEYIADVRAYETEGNPHIKELAEHAKINEYRSKDVFYLIDRFIVDSKLNPGQINFNSLYSILFDWNWNNPGYYAGYHMTKSIVSFKGEEALKVYLQKDPVFFIYDYIQLSKSEEGLVKFSETTEQIIIELIEAINKISKG